MMKKIILLPKTDTIILCLPEEWVGRPIICQLTLVFEQSINFDNPGIETERVILFLNKKKRKRNK